MVPSELLPAADSRETVSHAAVARQIVWILRLAIAIQAVGIASQYLYSQYEIESPLFNYLLYDREWPQDTAQYLDDLLVEGWLVVGLTLFIAPLATALMQRLGLLRVSEENRLWKIGGLLQRLLLGLILLVQLILVWAAWYRGTGERFNDLLPVEQSARWMIPVLLGLLLPRGGEVVSAKRFHTAMWLLRLTVAVTFFAHGLKAIYGQKDFIDYLLVAGSSLIGWEASEVAVTRLLTIIGWLDVAAAILVLARQWRSVAIYMALWGIITAYSRVVHSGMSSHFEVAIRSGNYCLPLAVLFYFRYTRSIQKLARRENAEK